MTMTVMATDGAARAGVVTTERGSFRTPCFMPVGTRGAVRAASTEDLAVLGVDGEPQPVGRLVTDPAGLAAQHRILVPEDQQFGIPGHLTSAQHHQAGEQTAHDQVDAREDHSGDDLSLEDATSQTRDRVIEPYRLGLIKTTWLPAAAG